MDQVAEFLGSLGLATYAAVLCENGFDTMEFLQHVSEADCVEMGFKKGHTRALLKALAEPEASAEPTTPKAPSTPSGPPPPRPASKVPRKKRHGTKKGSKRKSVRKKGKKGSRKKRGKSSPLKKKATSSALRAPPKPLPLRVDQTPPVRKGSRGPLPVAGGEALFLSAPDMARLEESIHVSSFLSRSLSDLSPNRDHIAREILSTEKTYVHHLSVIDHLYVQPILEWAKAKKKKNVKVAFSELAAAVGLLLPLHEQFLKCVAGKIDNWSATQCLGTAFELLSSHSKTFTGYVAAYEQVLGVLVECEKSDSFNMLVIERKHSLEVDSRKLDLRSHLIMPVQRLPRYEMLLNDLIKNTEEDHPDFHPLQVALAQVETMGYSVDRKVRSATHTTLQQMDSEMFLRVTEAEADASSHAGDSNHKFEVTSFTRPTYCAYCGSFIWGLTKQGYTCSQCLFPVHRKCLQLVVPDCGDLTGCLKHHHSASPRRDTLRSQQSTGVAAFTTHPHELKTFNFKKPTYCAVCTKLLVGLVKQGKLCRKCGYTVHRQCIANAPPLCRKQDMMSFGHIDLNDDLGDYDESSSLSSSGSLRESGQADF